MDNDIINYRKKYKNCKYCKYHCYKSKLEWSWEECILKDDTIYRGFNKIRPYFCGYYRVKEKQ